MKFSIIIPTYNRENLLKRGLESVIAQQYQNWEAIVVDDGGTDATQKMIVELREPRIKYFWKKNEERSIARNYGVKRAIGDYVFFLDSDDIIFPNHLQHCFDKIQENPSIIFFHSRYQEWRNGRKKNVIKLNQENIQQDISKQNYFGSQFFLKRDIAQSIPFSTDRRIKIGEDWLVVLQIAALHPLHISNKITKAVICHEGRSMVAVTCEDVLTSRDAIIDALKLSKYVSSSTIKSVYTELTSLAALNAAIHKKKKESFNLLLHLLRTSIQYLLKKRTIVTVKKLLFGK